MKVVALRPSSTAFDEVCRNRYSATKKLALESESLLGRERLCSAVDVGNEVVCEHDALKAVRISAHADDIGRRRQELLPEVRGPRPEAQGRYLSGISPDATLTRAS